MLLPRKTKFRKYQRGRRAGYSKGQTTVQFGDFGLKALENGWITNRQIEAARIAMTRKIKRGGKVWINVFPDKPVTAKPAETRMGSGKGSPEHWVAVIKPGRVMFELAGVPEPLAKEALRLAGAVGAHADDLVRDAQPLLRGRGLLVVALRVVLLPGVRLPRRDRDDEQPEGEGGEGACHGGSE